MPSEELTLKAIADFVVRVADLAEAEGRTLLTTVRTEAASFREALGRLGVALLFLVVAATLLALGAAILALAALLWLEGPVGRPAAAGITGAAAVVAATGFVAAFRWMTKA